MGRKWEQLIGERGGEREEKRKRGKRQNVKGCRGATAGLVCRRVAKPCTRLRSGVAGPGATAEAKLGRAVGSARASLTQKLIKITDSVNLKIWTLVSWNCLAQQLESDYRLPIFHEYCALW